MTGKILANLRWIAERGVQFIQHFHMGRDKPFNLPTALAGQYFDTDQPSAVV